MLYHLFNFLEEQYHLMGVSVFRYISFRAFAAAISSLLIAILFGRRLIRFLNRQQLREPVRPLGLPGENKKKIIPTMGGIIIILSVLFPTLLFSDLTNTYVSLLLFALVGMGMVGILDDYLKIKEKKGGLRGKFKIIGQIFLGIVVSLVLIFHEDVVIREFIFDTNGAVVGHQDVSSLRTTIPFVKNNELDYKRIFSFLGDYYWCAYFGLILFIIVSVSNGANLTDGLDGLASGTSAIAGLVLAIFAYLSGNVVFSNYLNILYIPHLGEVVIFCAAFVGACIGFLWYNTYPAQIFMGDTGSLSLGAVVAVLAIVVRKELLLPILGGVFLVESASVVLQVGYFKFTKWYFGTGKRVFLMAPLHHHFQKRGLHESKIVLRFWLFSILLGIFTLVTLKVR